MYTHITHMQLDKELKSKNKQQNLFFKFEKLLIQQKMCYFKIVIHV